MASSVCVSCTTNHGITSTTDSKMPKWLANINYVTRFKQRTPLTVYRQSNIPKLLTLDVSDILKTITLTKPQYLLVWGTLPIDQTQRLIGAKSAYDDFRNHQVIKVSSKTTKVYVYLQCPRPYRAQTISESKTKSYPRHIHFCFGAGGRWFSKNYTKNVYCNIEYPEFLRLRRMASSMVVNALSKTSFQKYHIPNSVNLPSTTSLRGSKLRQWFEQRQPHKTRKNITEVPIVVYCAHKTCQAGHRLTRLLVEQGFVNVYHYVGGNREYRKLRG